MPRVTPNVPSPKKGKAKKKPVKLTAEQIARRRRHFRLGVHAASGVAVAGGLLVGYTALAAHVRDTIVIADEPQNADAVAAGRAQSRWLGIVLADRPAWMTDDIAANICGPLTAELGRSRSSRYDAKLLDEAVALLAGSPWVREVEHVRRDGDTLVASCVWRQPVAIVRDSSSQYRLVADGAVEGRSGGVLLPMTYDYEQMGRVIGATNPSLRVIDGVAVPPPAPGQAWDAPELRAGLDMALMLYGREAAVDVTVIDVAGVAQPRLKNAEVGQTSPVVLKTRFRTDIYWGRPPAGSDFLVEATTHRKLDNLSTARELYRTSGKYPRWVDVRLDTPTQSRD